VSGTTIKPTYTKYWDIVSHYIEQPATRGIWTITDWHIIYANEPTLAVLAITWVVEQPTKWWYYNMSFKQLHFPQWLFEWTRFIWLAGLWNLIKLHIWQFAGTWLLGWWGRWLRTVKAKEVLEKLKEKE